jgi:tRNA threonylcarbamoyladenosine biosynthesis protein TsaB
VRLLAISASTEYCSAALQIGTQLLERELAPERAAAERILELVDALLAEAGIGLGSLDAIAFGRGPGAFTGVRLAASVTQGLAMSAALPVLAVSDLQAVAQAVANRAEHRRRVLICQDARMQEVYWGWFEILDGVAQPRSGERVSPPAALLALCAEEEFGDSAGAGSGFAAYPQLQALFRAAPDWLWPHLYPRAREIAQLAALQGLAAAVSAERAQPVYVRDQVATVPGALT